MRKKIISVILAAAMICSNMVAVNAAEVTGETPEVIQEETVEEEVPQESRAAADNQLASDQIIGMFLGFGDKTVSMITDKNYNYTLTIPNDIIVGDSVSFQLLMQNVTGMGITGQVGESYSMSFGSGSGYNLSDYLGQLMNFGYANISGKVGEVPYSYLTTGSRTGEATVIRSVSTDVDGAHREFIKHVAASKTTAKGAVLKAGGYIEVGADKVVFNPDYKDLVIGDSDNSFGDHEQDVRDYFLYKEGEASGQAQISVYLPKGSNLNLGGFCGTLTDDVLVEVSGLAEGYETLDASGTSILHKMAYAETEGDLVVAMLQSLNQLVKAADGRNVTVNIRFPNEVKPSQITLNTSEVTLNAGASYQLQATVLPENAADKTVTWTSSNTNIATVVNGKITGVAPGTAVITATTANGIKVECKVTVNIDKVREIEVVNGYANATKLKLSWEKVPGATKYLIYRSTRKNKGFKKIAEIKKTNYIDKKLTTGTKYYYKVKAYGNGVTSAFSAVRSGTPKLKAPRLEVTRKKKGAALSWNKLTYADGYHVYMKSSKNGKFKRIAKVTKAKHRENGLKSGKTYYFRVRGYRVVKGKKYYGFYSKVVKAKVR